MIFPRVGYLLVAAQRIRWACVAAEGEQPTVAASILVAVVGLSCDEHQTKRTMMEDGDGDADF
jgi:hypothetical protein